MIKPTLKKLLGFHSPAKRLRLYFILFFLEILFYTILIHTAIPILENTGLTWGESLFFVIQTMTTVGYDLVTFFPATNQMTIYLIIIIMSTGTFTVLMLIPAVLAPFLQDLLETTPPKKLPVKPDGHVVIVGYGELAKALIESLMISDLEIVIVEEDEEEAKKILRKFHKDVWVIWGDYNKPATWKHAFTDTAADIIICKDERLTATIILGISESTSGRIIAVVDDLSYDRYLRYSGAEYILSAKNFTGKILAKHAFLTPDVDTIYETVSQIHIKNGRETSDNALKLIKVPIIDGCISLGKTLSDLNLLKKYDVDILFFWKNGKFVMKPDPDDEIDSSTMLFLLGRAEPLSSVLENEFGLDKTGEKMAIIAGYGDVGRIASNDLKSLGISCVVIDPHADLKGVISGNAEYEDVLKEAHIEDAQVCIVAVNDDIVNIFTTLMARNLNPSLRILARANEASSVDKLYRAGADYVALLPTLGGQIIASIVLSDIVQVLLDLPNEQKVVMKHIMKNTPTTAGWIEKKSGTKILGIEGEAHTIIRPGPDESLNEGDLLIAVGEISTLKQFINLL